MEKRSRSKRKAGKGKGKVSLLVRDIKCLEVVDAYEKVRFPSVLWGAPEVPRPPYFPILVLGPQGVLFPCGEEVPPSAADYFVFD